MQIVEEVQRNKLRVAADFMTRQLEKLEVRNFDIPDHLFDISGGTAANLREKLDDIKQKIKLVNSDLLNAAVETIQHVSCSEDEVSKTLAPLFSKAVTHTPEEIQRARERKERGNPPGKKSDPLGDQLTWEQLLNHCKGKLKSWIISKDSDYCIKRYDKMFMNSFLYEELVRLNQLRPEVFCFDRIDEGIRDFVMVTGVKAEKLPTPEESKEIKEELDALPPLGWLSRGMDMYDANYTAVLSHAMHHQKNFAAIAAAAMSNQGWHSGMLPDATSLEP